ncbi:hypothetical protein DFH28DRAFT_892393, partial [Melampsora americana]
MARGLAASNSSQNTEAALLKKFAGQLPFRLGPMTHACVHCGALRFSEERSKENQRAGKGWYLNCCQYGAVTLPLKFMPGVAKEFQKNISTYNNALSFTSLGVQRDEKVMGEKGPYVFRIYGQLSHSIP